ncbi:MAG: SHD1 domain-containing protein, partial [Kiritimatiellae bacterium]|nr:SHD1 domain-containing protein [Kiritimatiellia bacterium]
MSSRLRGTCAVIALGFMLVSLRAQEATPAATNPPAAAQPGPAVTNPPPAKPPAPKPAAAPANPKLRTWKSVNGSEIAAEYVDMADGVVKLKNKDGAPMQIRVGNLSPADQKWLSANYGEGTGAIAPPARSNSLPTFADGKWKGSHAVYLHPNFDAVMAANGSIAVYPKADGKRTGKALSFALSCFYVNTDMNPARQIGRPVIQFFTPPQPRKQPDEILLKGLLDDD